MVIRMFTDPQAGQHSPLCGASFYLRLTERRQDGNHPLATVSPMATTHLHLSQESDPAAMLCQVLMLVAAIVLMAALALLWWLA